jgi:hypothetical protein
MLIFSVTPAWAQEPSPKSVDPMAEFRVEQLKKAFNAIEGTRWYQHHRQYDRTWKTGSARIIVTESSKLLDRSLSPALPLPTNFTMAQILLFPTEAGLRTCSRAQSVSLYRLPAATLFGLPKDTSLITRQLVSKFNLPVRNACQAAREVRA